MSKGLRTILDDAKEQRAKLLEKTWLELESHLKPRNELYFVIKEMLNSIEPGSIGVDKLKAEYNQVAEEVISIMKKQNIRQRRSKTLPEYFCCALVWY